MNRRQWLHGLAGVAGVVGVAPIRRVLAADGGPVPTAKAPMIADPDSDPRTPAFRLSKGTVDTHCHVFGPVSRFPYSPDRPYTPPEVPYEALRALDAKLGIDRAVLVNATVYGRDNDIIVDAIARSGGACRGMGNVDDRISDMTSRHWTRAGSTAAASTFSPASSGCQTWRSSIAWSSGSVRSAGASTSASRRRRSTASARNCASCRSDT
jgi:hypothetical protein